MTRKNIFMFILCAFSAVTLVLFSGCDKKASLNGNVARPTWTAPAETDDGQIFCVTLRRKGV